MKDLIVLFFIIKGIKLSSFFRNNFINSENDWRFRVNSIRESIEQNPIIVIALIFIICQVFVLIIPNTLSTKDSSRGLSELVEEDYDSLVSQKLFPDNFKKKNIEKQLSRIQSNKITSKTNASLSNGKIIPTKVSSISSKTKKANPISPTPSISTSTVEGRDRERKIAVQVITNNISDYYFLHGKLPLLYKNKSKGELSDEPSNIVYFYNGDENKTNAVAFTLGDDSYKFIRVRSCESNYDKLDIVRFVYNEVDVVLCKEDKSMERFFIVK